MPGGWTLSLECLAALATASALLPPLALRSRPARRRHACRRARPCGISRFGSWTRTFGSCSELSRRGVRLQSVIGLKPSAALHTLQCSPVGRPHLFSRLYLLDAAALCIRRGGIHKKGEKASVRRGIWDEDTNVEVYPTNTASTVQCYTQVSFVPVSYNCVVLY